MRLFFRVFSSRGTLMLMTHQVSFKAINYCFPSTFSLHSQLKMKLWELQSRDILEGPIPQTTFYFPVSTQRQISGKVQLFTLGTYR